MLTEATFATSSLGQRHDLFWGRNKYLSVGRQIANGTCVQLDVDVQDERYCGRLCSIAVLIIVVYCSPLWPIRVDCSTLQSIVT